MGSVEIDSQVASRRVLGTGACMAVVLALAGCGGVDVLQSLGGGSSPALNITEKAEPPVRDMTPGEAKAARAHLGEAAKLAAARSNPGDVDAVLAASGILRRQGDKAGALALLEASAAVAPNDARLLRDRGLLALELGSVSRARDHLRKALSNGSRDWQTHSALGSALAAGGDQKAAQRQFAEALKLAPDNPVVLNNLALSMALEGRRGDAEQMLRRASAGQPKAGDGRVAQNLALVSKISERKGNAASKPAETPPAKQSSAPQPEAKDVKKGAAAPAPTRTAQAD